MQAYSLPEDPFHLQMGWGTIMSCSYSNGLKSCNHHRVCLFVCLFVSSLSFPSPVSYSLNVTFASYSHGAKKLVGQKTHLWRWLVEQKWAYPILFTLISSLLSPLSTFLLFVPFLPSPFPNIQNLQRPPISLHSTMSNKPSAKAIARLNATTLFPEIKKGTPIVHSHTRKLAVKWHKGGHSTNQVYFACFFFLRTSYRNREEPFALRYPRLLHLQCHEEGRPYDRMVILLEPCLVAIVLSSPCKEQNSRLFQWIVFLCYNMVPWQAIVGRQKSSWTGTKIILVTRGNYTGIRKRTV